MKLKFSLSEDGIYRTAQVGDVEISIGRLRNSWVIRTDENPPRCLLFESTVERAKEAAWLLSSQLIAEQSAKAFADLVQKQLGESTNNGTFERLPGKLAGHCSSEHLA